MTVPPRGGAGWLRTVTFERSRTAADIPMFLWCQAAVWVWCVLDLSDQGVETVPATGDQCDGGAAAGEFSGSGVTDAAPGAGDDGDGAGELLAHDVQCSSLVQIRFW